MYNFFKSYTFRFQKKTIETVVSCQAIIYFGYKTKRAIDFLVINKITFVYKTIE